ncbi:MAG TPA: glutathione S-transferase family protein [Leucothrix mucor]|nr:glutathione S-transferase family protein [Leucothrix mucor]
MSDLTLIIGNKNYSSWSLRPWLYMKQQGIDFEEIRIPLFTSEMESQLEPCFSNSKVPVLIDDGYSVWDSLAIMEYLADKIPENVSWPAYIKARATARSAASEMHSSFNGVRNEMPMNCSVQYSDVPLSEEALQDIERIKALWRHCKRFYGQDGKWLFSQFTIADAMFAPIVIRFKHFNIPLEDIEAEYVDMVYNSKYMQEWIKAGREETEIIDVDELDMDDYKVS